MWVPVGLLLVFAVITWIRGPQYGAQMAEIYLCWMTPLLAGVLSAYAVLEDPVLELHFASPRPGWRFLLERMALVLSFLGIGALLFQLFLWAWDLDLSFMGNWVLAQMIWLLPSLTTASLGCAFALLCRQSAAGAMLVGILWIFEAVARSWFAAHPVAGLFYIAISPHSPILWLNRLTLSSLALVCFLSARALFAKQERYI